MLFLIKNIYLIIASIIIAYSLSFVSKILPEMGLEDTVFTELL